MTVVRTLRTFAMAVVGTVFLGAQASVAQDEMIVSPDITLDLALIAADEDALVDSPLVGAAIVDLGPLPANADIVAFDRDANGDLFFALDTTVELPGSVVVQRGDIVRWDGTVYSIAFDASRSGVPSGAVVDALDIQGNNRLLSFDTTVELPAPFFATIVAADEDVVLFKSGTFLHVFDGSAEGIGDSLDLDAVQDLPGNAYLVSFDTAGEIAGVVFDDEDILRFDAGSWSLEQDTSATDLAWQSGDLDALFVPEPRTSVLLAAGAILVSVLSRRSIRVRGREVGLRGGRRLCFPIILEQLGRKRG